MLVVVCMPLTLLPADAASLHAGLHGRPGELWLELGLPTEDVPRRRADIAAVQTQPDAADQHADVVLAEIRVRAGCAALRAVEAGVDAGKQRSALDRGSTWVRLQHLPSVGHSFSIRRVPATLSLNVGRVKG
jgi:hypothetical protein